MLRPYYCPKNTVSTTVLMSMLIVSMMTMGLVLTKANVGTTPVPPLPSPIQKLSPAVLEATSAIETPVNLLIETYGSNYESVVAEISRLGGAVSFQYKYINALAATLPADKVALLAENKAVKKIYLDEKQTPSYRKPFVDGTGSESTWVDKNAMDGRDFYNLALSPKNPIVESAVGTNTYNTLRVPLTPEQFMTVDPTTYWNPVSMGAIPVWLTNNFGQGSLAVIIDTGVYKNHFMLADLGSPYPPTVIGGVDLSADVDTPYEGWSSPNNHWHGTHVAGILAGHGAILVQSSHPLYRSISTYATPPQEASSIGYPGWHLIPLTGMAPLAQIFAIKVFPHTGEGAPTSTIIAGIEYAIDMKLDGTDVDIISMSLGGPTVFDGRDLEAQTVDYATSIGITVVASAGNDGPAPMTVGSPGTANTAITAALAAHPVNTRVYWDYYYGKQGIGWQLFTSDTPQIYEYSSRGPTSDGRDKPTVSATGMMVLSAMPDSTDPQGLGWASGTSMSAPAVSGTVALLNSYAEVYAPTASPTDYKQAVEGGAVWLPSYTTYDQGAGYLNAANAMISLQHDASLGDLPTPLPPTYSLMDITNVPIVGSGVYSESIVDLMPGHKLDFVFTVDENTDSITLEVENVRRNIRNPYGLNSFEVYIQSAKRTGYFYWIDSANVFGNAVFHITDDVTTWSGAVSGVFWDELTRYTCIESGYVKVTIENDWTSSGPLSGDITITVTSATPPAPDLKYSGTIVQDQWIKVPTIGSIYPPLGTTKVVIELWWENDWTTYPASDLDMYATWFNGTHWIWEPSYEGASLNSPERITITGLNIIRFYILINGYAIYTGTDSWTIKIYYS